MFYVAVTYALKIIETRLYRVGTTMTRSNNGVLGSGKYIQGNVAAVSEFNALPKALTCYGAHLAT
jgi:hypothetical protein